MKDFIFLSSVSCAVPDTSSNAVDIKFNSSLTRRSDLPLYSKISTCEEKNIEETANSTVLTAVRSFRKEACHIVRSANAVINRCEKFIDTGIAHSYGSYINAVDHLREEKNLLPRIGAITGGVLFGYIISFRKGFFKRLIYSTTGGITLASVCYPTEAQQYACKSIQSSKKYVVIGYHFLNGVTKDLGGFELPEFPLRMLNSGIQETEKESEKTK